MFTPSKNSHRSLPNQCKEMQPSWCALVDKSINLPLPGIDTVEHLLNTNEETQIGLWEPDKNHMLYRACQPNERSSAWS